MLIFIFAAVKTGNNKLLFCAVFLGIFLIKMAISVAPVFLMINNNTVNAVIMQLELEDKNEKDSSVEKGFFKYKKFFDEAITVHCYHITPILFETNMLHNLEQSLFVQTYHPIVPTPPPNA